MNYKIPKLLSVITKLEDVRDELYELSVINDEDAVVFNSLKTQTHNMVNCLNVILKQSLKNERNTKRIPM